MSVNPYRLRHVPTGIDLMLLVERHPGLAQRMKADLGWVRDAEAGRGTVSCMLRSVRRNLDLTARIEFTRDLFAAWRVAALQYDRICQMELAMTKRAQHQRAPRRAA